MLHALRPCRLRRTASSGMIGEGLTNREIAARIHLSDKTVKNYVSTILQKLDVTRRAEAAAYIATARAEHPRTDI